MSIASPTSSVPPWYRALTGTGHPGADGLAALAVLGLAGDRQPSSGRRRRPRPRRPRPGRQRPSSRVRQKTSTSSPTWATDVLDVVTHDGRTTTTPSLANSTRRAHGDAATGERRCPPRCHLRVVDPRYAGHGPLRSLPPGGRDVRAAGPRAGTVSAGNRARGAPRCAAPGPGAECRRTSAAGARTPRVPGALHGELHAAAGRSAGGTRRRCRPRRRPPPGSPRRAANRRYAARRRPTHRLGQRDRAVLAGFGHEDAELVLAKADHHIPEPRRRTSSRPATRPSTSSPPRSTRASMTARSPSRS